MRMSLMEFLKRRLRRFLYWTSDKLRCLAHRIDRISDSTCENQGDLIKTLVDLLQDKTSNGLGFSLTAEHIELIIRLNTASEKLRDECPGFADSYLISKLQGVLPIEIKRRLVEDLEREVGIVHEDEQTMGE